MHCSLFEWGYGARKLVKETDHTQTSVYCTFKNIFRRVVIYQIYNGVLFFMNIWHFYPSAKHHIFSVCIL